MQVSRMFLEFPYDLSPIGPNGCDLCTHRAPETSTAWSSANRALFYPMRVVAPCVAQIAYWFNGATASGNVDIGIYDRVGTRLVSGGSTAQSGTNAVQSVNITDTLLGPGIYYLGLALSSTSGTIFIFDFGTTQPFAKFLGGYQQASALPLPATATFATLTTGHFPRYGIMCRAVL